VATGIVNPPSQLRTGRANTGGTMADQRTPTQATPFDQVRAREWLDALGSGADASRARTTPTRPVAARLPTRAELRAEIRRAGVFGRLRDRIRAR
jgi:hypothetical protein